MNIPLEQKLDQFRRAYLLSMDRWGKGSIEQQNKRMKARARMLQIIGLLRAAMAAQRQIDNFNELSKSN